MLGKPSTYALPELRGIGGLQFQPALLRYGIHGQPSLPERALEAHGIAILDTNRGQGHPHLQDAREGSRRVRRGGVEDARAAVLESDGHAPGRFELQLHLHAREFAFVARVEIEA